MSLWRTLPLLGLLVLAAPAGTYAQIEDFEALEAARERVAAVDDSLRQAQDRLEEAMKAGQETADQLAALQAESVAAGLAIRQHEKDIALLEGELQRWKAQEAREAEEFQRENENLAALLGVLARLARLPAEPMILGDGDANNQVRTALTARSVINKVEAKTSQLRERLQRLAATRAQLQERSDDTMQARAALLARISSLDAVIAAREAVLEADGERQAQAQRRVDDLSDEAGLVGQILRSLESDIVSRAALSALDPPIADVPTVDQQEIAPSEGPSIVQVPDQPEEFTDLDEVATRALTPAPGDTLPPAAETPTSIEQEVAALPPEELVPEEQTLEEPPQGPRPLLPDSAIPNQSVETGGPPQVVLALPESPDIAPVPGQRPREEHTPLTTASLGVLTPVSGNITLGFGEQNEFGQVHKGMTIQTGKALPILSPLAGTIRFAGPFQEYGRLLIIEHEDGYHSLVAGLGRIDVDAGQQVLSGEPIGATPAPQTTGTNQSTGINQTTGSNSVEIYYELRQGGVPINPIRGLELARQRGEG